VNYFETLVQDLRYGLRTLRKNPGFTVVTILTLALGIGASTAIFSYVNAWMIKPLPYPKADRLMGDRLMDQVEFQPHRRRCSRACRGRTSELELF
jgi:hypothetical protein